MDNTQNPRQATLRARALRAFSSHEGDFSPGEVLFPGWKHERDATGAPQPTTRIEWTSAHVRRSQLVASKDVEALADGAAGQDSAPAPAAVPKRQAAPAPRPAERAAPPATE